MLKRYQSVKKAMLSYLLKDQKGATAIEYGLIAGLIAAVLVTILRATGNSLNNIFTTIQQAIDLAAN